MLKVILLNGSPSKSGCTHTALEEVAQELKQCGVETEEFWIGTKPAIGCLGCGKCLETKRCWYDKDKLNEFLGKMENTDGLVVGTPIHFAGASGLIKPFLDRAFYGKSSIFENKPAAAVVSCRRGGASAGYDDINRFFGISSMPIVTSQYWNQVHGNTPEEVKQDGEGLQTMRRLAQNMAWLLKCIEFGKQNGIALPKAEERIRTNFIR
ncbi:MAG: flavodoxin family protein [Prevotella sp.]|nr:flavodoxin family protein [Prevotella sp.]